MLKFLQHDPLQFLPVDELSLVFAEWTLLR
jgi:hypothetical protein